VEVGVETPVEAQPKKWKARVGDLAVYPGQGVAKIEDVRTQEIAGHQLEFVVLRMIEDASRILIPRDRVDDVGLRRVMSKADAARIWEILRIRKRRRRRTGVTWSRQFREYQDKLKTGSVFEIAEVLRDLLRLQLEKELSFGERRVLDSARSLLVQELAAAQNTGADNIEAELKETVR
jgi:CarD family transcriptional regulator